MKRVLEVFGEPISRGGQESYVMSALQNMKLSDLHIDLFTPYYCDNQLYVDYINSIGGHVSYAEMPFKVGGTRREVISCFDNYLQKNEKYDVVHIHSGSISVLAYYARVASKNGVEKVIVHSHSSGAKENIKHFLMKLYAAGIFKTYATDFCACSIEAARWKFPKSVLPKVKILNNGIDLKKYKYDAVVRKKNRERYCIDEDVLVLGHVGRFTSEKNQEFLIDVLQKYIHRNCKKNLLLILVGDGYKLEYVERKAKETGLDKNIRFIGATDNVVDYLQVMDIFLFPSLYEGLGIVGIEAQAVGLPVIASANIPKSMDVTGNVAFVSLEDVNAWCDEIDKVKQKVRINYFDSIRQKGFDIVDTSEKVRKLYFE